MISFDKIVNKMLKKGGKIILKNDIFELVDPEKKSEYSTKVNKIIYQLKSKNIIISMRNGVYLIPQKGDEKLNEIDLIEKYYFSLVKKYITQTVGSDYYLSGKKSLEFHMKNFIIPQKMIIINRSVNKKIFIGDYILVFKTITSVEDGKQINLFSKMKPFTQLMEVDSNTFRISSLELALLESALITENDEGIDIQFLNKVLKKYAKFFKKDSFYDIGKYKYAMSINRLKEMSKGIDQKLYETFLDIIKKNGGNFIGEGLRKGV